MAMNAKNEGFGMARGGKGEAAVRQETARDPAWLIRTYAGHSTAAASNALYRGNLAKGQTGLSVAFDLPTQTGYDADHPLARGEVGKVGVPVSHLGDMETLFEGIPLERMNTSMTINATAPWLLALYVACAEKQGVPRAALQGTTQNDIFKEYLSRGTYIFPPRPSLKLIGDVVAFTVAEVPKWNPVNVCSYHLQEAGATPVQELAYALATAIAVLDAVKAGGQVPEAEFPKVVGRISFFVNAGVRFVTELCKMRAFTELWDEVCRARYGIEEEKYRRFRYGVQVNSLGLTEQQPENNVYRILLEMLAVVLSKNARARAVQLPAWNEALGLPRPWDQQWSLRLQQILAYETDLLEYGDLFDGNPVVEAKVAELVAGAREELAQVEALGGAVAAVEIGYMKERLVASAVARFRAVESGEQVVVGVNRFTETEPSPLTAGGDGGFLQPDPEAEARQLEGLRAWRAARDDAAASRALAALEAAAREAQPDGALDRLRPRRRDHRRVGRGAAPGLGRVPRAHRRRPQRAGGGGRPRAPGAAARPRRRGLRAARAAPEDAGGQARARRPLQRRRTDRRARPRRRLRGGLRGHPPDPGADRRRRPGGGRARHRPLHPLRQPSAAGGRHPGPAAPRRVGRDPDRGRRHHPAGGRRGAAPGRRRRRLYPQGLRHHRDPGRDRRDRRSRLGGGGLIPASL